MGDQHGDFISCELLKTDLQGAHFTIVSARKALTHGSSHGAG